MAFLYSILPEYTKNNDILEDKNVNGTVKTLEEYLNIIDSEIFDLLSDSIKEILTYTSVYKIKSEYLPYISYLLGYKWNFNLDIELQRNILASILKLYKRKGTKFSFNFNLYNLDPNITLYEPYKDIFILNKSNFDIIDSYVVWKSPVDVATTENITLSGLQVIDNINIQSNYRILVKDQTNVLENGIYIADTGIWTKAADSDTNEKMLNSVYYIKRGRINKNIGYKCTKSDETEIIFEKLNYKKDRIYHLTSRNYYSWGILVLRVDNPIKEIYELFSMVHPAGWKIILETEYGIYFSLHIKPSGLIRNYYINKFNLTEDDFIGEEEEYYENFINSINYVDTKVFIDIILMGQIFDLNGIYFTDFDNNYLTLEDIEHYNLYYESEENDYTLLRYSTHYTYYSDEG